MNRFHPLLMRQIQQSFGNVESIPENCREFVDAVNALLQRNGSLSEPPSGQVAGNPDRPDAGNARDLSLREKVETEIRKSESKYRMLFESANDPIIIFRPADERILEVNQKACDVYGFSRQEFTSMSLRSITKDKLRGDSLIRSIISDSSGKHENFSTVHFGKDGKEIHFHSNAYCIDYDGEQAIVAINRDTTQWMQTEARLRENQERLRLISENVTDYIAILDANGNFRFLTDSFRQLGYDPPSLDGMSILEFVHGEDKIRFANELHTATDSYASRAFEFRFRRKDGSWMNAEIVITVMVGDEVAELVIAMHDITERLSREEELEKFSLAIRQSPVSIVITDTSGTIEYVNPKFCEVTGYSSGEAIGQNIRIVGSSQTPIEQYASLWKTILAGKEWRGEFRNRKKNGELFWDRAFISPVKNHHGTIVHFIAIYEDITEKKKSDEALKYERTLLRTVIDNLPDAIFAKDTAFRRTLANRADVHNMGGSSESDVLGKDDYEFFPKDLADGFRADDMTVLTTGRPLANREEYVPDGKEGKRWLLTTKLPLRDEKGKIIGLVGIGRDITELKGIEDALSEKNSLLQTLIDLIPDYIYVKDTESRFLLGNKSLIRSFGKETIAEIYGKTDHDFHPPENARQFFADEQEIIRTGQPLLNKDEPAVLPTGERIWIVSTKLPLRDKQGRIMGLVGIGRDITKRKLAEDELRKSEATLRLIMDNTFDGISIYEESPVDLRRRLIECNRRYAEMAGRTREELLQIGETIPLQKSINAEEKDIGGLWDLAGEAHSGSLREGKNYRGSFSWIRPDGKENIIEYSAVPITIAGRILSIGLDRDITERVKMEEDLRNGQNLLRTVIDNIPEAIYAKDTSCRKTISNPADVRNIGRTSEAEVLGKNDFDLFPKELAEGFYADDKAVITTGRGVVNREEFVLDETGQKRWLLTTKLPLRDQKGEIIGLVGIGLDVTERKIAEEKLRKSEENFVRMALNIEDILYSVDAESMEYRYLSPAFERILGYTEEDIRTMGGRRSFLSRVIIEEKYMHHGGVHAATPAHLRGGTGDYYEAWWRCKDGTIKCLEDHWIPVFKDGRLVSTDGVMRDVTERKKADEELRISGENFRRMAAHIDEVLYTVDEVTQEFLYLSPVFTKMLGYTSADIKQMGGRKAFLAFVTHEPIYIEPKESIDDLPSLNSFDVSGNHATWWRCKDGTPKYIEDRWIGHYERNRLVRTDGVLRDMTEQQQLEQERSTSEGRLKDRNAELEQMLHDLQSLREKSLRAEQMAAVQRLAESVFTEIDAPLRALFELVAPAHGSDRTAPPPDLLKKLSGELTRIKNVTDRLRDACRRSHEQPGGEDILKILGETIPGPPPRPGTKPPETGK